MRKPFFHTQVHGIVIGRIIAAMVILLFSVSISFAQGETVRIANCLAGCPQGGSADNDLIVRPVYALSFNHQTRMADWVAYVVTAGSIGVATNLSREPIADPFVNDTLRVGDYEHNAEELSLQRNYLVPLVSFAGTPFWNDINYLTNMVPRNPDLNRGSWYGLEWAVRNLANRTDALYIIAGPIFDPQKPQPGLQTNLQHKVPSGFFKVVATNRGQVAAFTFDQDLPFHVHHCDQLTTLDEIELLTGFDLFPEAADWPEGDLSQQLGCYR